MPEQERPEIKPPLNCSFDQIYEKLLLQPNKKITGLFTTGNVEFEV